MTKCSIKDCGLDVVLKHRRFFGIKLKCLHTFESGIMLLDLISLIINCHCHHHLGSFSFVPTMKAKRNCFGNKANELVRMSTWRTLKRLILLCIFNFFAISATRALSFSNVCVQLIIRSAMNSFTSFLRLPKGRGRPSAGAPKFDWGQVKELKSEGKRREETQLHNNYDDSLHLQLQQRMFNH